MVECYCGGTMVFNGSTCDYQCPDCGFSYPDGFPHIFSNHVAGVKALRQRYVEHQRRKSDPMNLLPAHYQ